MAYDFRKYLPYFLQDIPDERCAKAGRAAYFDVRFLSFNFLKLFHNGITDTHLSNSFCSYRHFCYLQTLGIEL